MLAPVSPAPSGAHVARHEADSKLCKGSYIEKPTHEAEFRNCPSALYQLVKNWTSLYKPNQSVLISFKLGARYANQFVLINHAFRFLVRGEDDE